MISRKHIISIGIAATLLSGCAVSEGLSNAGFHARYPADEMRREHADMHREGEQRMQEHRQRMEHGQTLEQRMQRDHEQMGQRSRQFERNDRTEQRFDYQERTSRHGSYTRIRVPSPWRD